MSDRILRGQGVSPGVAVGAVRVFEAMAMGAGSFVLPARRAGELRRALAALDAAEAELDALAARLRAEGRVAESELIEVGALMVEDPTLRQGVRQHVEDGATAADAIMAAAEASAEMLAELDDPDLAGRAVDVRSVARRAARLALAAGPRDEGTASRPPPASDVILIAPDLGPADVAELGPDVRAVVLAEGGVTAHAAIVARSRGLPMVVQCGAAALALPEGQVLVVDGTAGTIKLAPDAEQVALISRFMPRAVTAVERDLPTITRDGVTIHVLANVAGVPEVDLALAAGAEGVGLLRTELAFLDATSWPSEEEHWRSLRPILDRLAGRVATVRLLDFGGDKTPPFLRAGPVDTNAVRGIGLMTQKALAAQVRAIAGAGHTCQLRVLIPMVRTVDDIQRVRAPLLEAVARGPSRPEPVLLGAMIETPEAVVHAPELARRVGFFSIGTNDLAHLTLGFDRATATVAPAHHPSVLREIDAVVRAAASADKPVAVCGEAASDPLVMPLLIGLGVRELSVGAARVAAVRRWARALDTAGARQAAEQALAAADLETVVSIAEPLRRALLAAEASDDSGDGGLGIRPLSHDP
jgi:phosphoenolpyruvate-protein phosphotransferase